MQTELNKLNLERNKLLEDYKMLIDKLINNNISQEDFLSKSSEFQTKFANISLEIQNLEDSLDVLIPLIPKDPLIH